MDIPFKTRQLKADEKLFLNKLKAKMGKKGYDKVNYYHFLIATLLGIGFTYLTINSNTTLISGLLASAAYSFIVVKSYLINAARRDQKAFLNTLNMFIDKGTVDTCLVNAKRIAVAEKTRYGEDVGSDIYIIEYDDEKVLYLHDILYYKFTNKFPCLDFEIYECKFASLTKRLIDPLSEHVKPLTLYEPAKSRYMRRYDEPEHLQIQSISFDKIVADINNCT